MTTSMNDAEIKKNIQAELKKDPEVCETDIGVIVKDGAVTLTGTVPSYLSKTAAKRAAKRIRHVQVIADEISVKLPSEMTGTDEDIAKRIANIFKWHLSIPQEVQAVVRDGYVTLSGTVDWQFQRQTAESQIEGLPGVKQVYNEIIIRQRLAPQDVKSKIADTLHRYANTALSKIKITVNGSVVTLDGSVEHYSDISLIEKAVWAEPGVTDVVDNLRVG